MKTFSKHICNLELDVVNDADSKFVTCDVCGKEYSFGDRRFWIIKCNCGNTCSRNLCEQCIEQAYTLLFGEK